MPALITSARTGKSLDTDQRNRRYLASMAIRVACFLAGCFTPFPYNIGFFVGAALIPGFAVILANAMDNHAAAPEAADAPPTQAPALTSGLVVPGDIAEAPGP